MYVTQRGVRPVARPWTQWVQRLSSVGDIYVQMFLYRRYIILYYTYMLYIHVYYVCISIKSAFVRATKSTLRLRNALIAQNILHFWEWVILHVTAVCFVDDTRRQLSKLQSKVSDTITHDTQSHVVSWSFWTAADQRFPRREMHCSSLTNAPTLSL